MLTSPPDPPAAATPPTARLPPAAEYAATVVIVACLVAPLIVGREILFPYVVPRAVFVRAALGLGLAVLLTLVFTRRYHLPDPRDPILASLSIFLLISGVTSLVGVSPLRSLFGEMERMWGVITWFYFLVLYALLRILGEDRWDAWLRISVGVGVLTAFQALLQRFGQELPISIVGASRGTVFGTLGNPSYLSIYMMFQMGFAALLVLRAEARRDRWSYTAALAVCTLAFTLGGGRSALIGIGAGIVVGAALLWWVDGRRSRSRHVRRAVAYVIAAAVVLAGLVASPLGQSNAMVQRLMGVSLADTTFTTRFAAWRVAWQAFLDNPLFGIGFENFQVAFARYYPPYIDDIGGSSVWDRGHNLYLDLLASVGVFGFLAYVAIWVAYFWSVRAALRSGRASGRQAAVLAAIGVAYLVYLIMWFEDHASTISLVVLFAYVSSLRSGAPLVVFERTPEQSGSRRILLAVAFAVIALFTWQHAFRVYETGRATVAAQRAQSVEQRLDLFGEALDASGSVGLIAVGLYTDYLRSFTVEAAEIRDRPEQARTLASAVERGLIEVDRAIGMDPHNDVWWIDQGRLLALSAELLGSRRHHRASLESIRQAIAISPTQPRLYHLLAELHLVTGDTDSALVVLHSALDLRGGRARTLYFISRAHRVAGDRESSLTALESALREGEIGRRGLVVWHLEHLAQANRHGDALGLLDAYRSAHADPHGALRTLSREDFELLSRRPLLALRLARPGDAIGMARELMVAYPPGRDALRGLIGDVLRGRGAAWTAHRDLQSGGRAFGGLAQADRFRR